jgi:hypothetical protein
MMDDDFIDWILAGKKKPQSNKNNGYNRYVVWQCSLASSYGL